MPVNVLFVTFDQFRGDCLGVAGHPQVRTPHLDRLAAEGVRFARHYSQAAPCSPGRACLYTGTYQFNNRVVGNGTPLDDRFDNVAHAARRAGFDPALFGYTDQGIDPRSAAGPDDPRLSTFEGILPGFTPAFVLNEDQAGWIAWLATLGYAVPENAETALRGEPTRPAEHGVSAFLTDRFLEWLPEQPSPWWAHVSYFRPHPPFAAAGEWSRSYDPGAVALPVRPGDNRHVLHDILLGHPVTAAPTDERAVRAMIAQYYGMLSAVDHEFGRIRATLEATGQWEDTFVIVTSDHAEYLGNHGLIQKGGFFEESYHVPCLVRDPRPGALRGVTVTAFTENVDIFPTLCDAVGLDVPAQCDGLPLTPFLRGQQPAWWREAAYWEFDWRTELLPFGPYPWPWDRQLERQNLAVRRSERYGYVQFGDGSWRCFDLAADPTWRTEVTDPAVVLPEAQAMLGWRAAHAERTMTGLLLRDGGIGRWPPPRQPATRRGAAPRATRSSGPGRARRRRREN